MSPSKRPLVIKNIREEREHYFNEDLDPQFKKVLGCTYVATFGTMTSKSAILAAMRGYRSDDFPEGIDNDTAQYIASLVSVERGFVWSLSDMINGNEEKDRKPNKTFIDEVNKYPGLLDAMLKIENCVDKRSAHASGIIMFEGDPFERCCFMKTPKGEIITQWDLHDAEYAGNTKFDALVTEGAEIISYVLKLLQKYDKFDKNLSLKEIYYKYLDPEKLPINDEKIWNHIGDNNIVKLFQFDSDVGRQAIKKVNPHSIKEMADANSLMRLMVSQKGQESPLDKYVRFKNNIQEWYKEMRQFGLTAREQKILEPHFLKSHGIIADQESLMLLLMDKKICGFSLKEANNARKIIAKKKMSEIPVLKEKVIKSAQSPSIGHYVWDYGVTPSLGYSFSLIHSTAYSYIGFQEAYIATKWNSVFWNTACLVVDSGAIKTEDSDDEKGTDYGKLGRALCSMQSQGIDVSLVDINKSDYIFEPDEENNKILFGMKAINGINNETMELIKKNRPYFSFKDFLSKNPLLKKIVIIMLIKAGSFNELEKEWGEELNLDVRFILMAYYLSIISEPKKKLTLQNLPGLIKANLLPEQFEEHKKIFYLNKQLKKQIDKDYPEYYIFNSEQLDFFCSAFDNDLLLSTEDSRVCIKIKDWDKAYKNKINEIKNWMNENKEEILKEFNYLLFKEYWDKYAQGNISSWEMQSLCFYHGEHELAKANTNVYGISEFENLPYNPEVDNLFYKNGVAIPIFKLTRIIGTVIDKNDVKNSVTLSTTGGVVNVKLTKEYYAMFNKQISEIQPDGKKKIIEKGWFSRGTKLLFNGFRREDTFVCKVYKNKGANQHRMYKIENVTPSGELVLTHERAKGVAEDE